MEQTFLHEGNVQVTHSRIVIDNHTYPINGITVVRSDVIPASRSPKRTLSILLGIFGCLMGVGSGGNATMIFWVAVLFGSAILLWLNAKALFHIYLGTAGGEKEVLSSSDKAFVDRVAQAINEALVSRG